MSSVHASNLSETETPHADRRTAVLVTGAGGEMGHGLIRALAERDSECAIVGLDLRPADDSIGALCAETLTGDIRDTELLEDLAGRYRFGRIFHLAAMLMQSRVRRRCYDMLHPLCQPSFVPAYQPIPRRRS